MNKSVGTTIAVVLIVGVAGFFAGSAYGRGASAGASGAGQGRQFAGGQAGNGARLFRGAAAGSIIAKDANSITLQLSDGSTRIVFVSASTTIVKASAASAGDLAVGQEVFVNGSSNPDGSVNAQNVQLRPAGLMGPGFGGPRQ